MPNISAPASFAYDGGSLRCNRINPAQFGFTSGSFISSRESPVSSPAEIPDLNRLTRYDRPASWDEANWIRFMAMWQQFATQIEGAFEAVNARVDEVALYARLAAVEQKAEAANDNATAARQEAQTVSAATRETFTRVDPALGAQYDELLP